MVDIHSHVLPGIDDGAPDVETSIRMLRQSKENGVETVIATSHCYIKHEDDIKIFLKKREESYKALVNAMEKCDEELPDVKLGCEVNLSRDISKFDLLEKLCVEGTDYILIEMPYNYWDEVLFDAIYYITLRKMKPVMAHIERFFRHSNKFESLLDLDIFYQINADSVLEPKMNRFMSASFKNEIVKFIGSDMHNTEARPTQILKAYDKIAKIYGVGCADYLMENSYRLVENREVDSFVFKKKNIFTRFGK